MKRIALLALCTVFTSCNVPRITLTRLAAHYRVEAEKQEPLDVLGFPVRERPELRVRAAIKNRVGMPLVPYAQLDLVSMSGHSVMRSLWKEGAKHRADLVEVFGASTETSPTVVTTHIALGVSIGSQAQILRASAILYRWASCRFGFSIDDTRMVIEVFDVARNAGVLEGDRLVAVDGVEVDTNPANSTYLRVLLEKKAGDSVCVDMIRPGKGKVAMHIRLVPAKRTALDGENPIEWDLPMIDDHSNE